VLPNTAADRQLDIAAVWADLRELRRMRIEVIPIRRRDFEETEVRSASWRRRLRAKVASSMGVEPKKTSKPIAKLLHAAGLDLDAATRLLAEPPNVLAANHLQQAAEKILAAVRLHRGLLNTRDHDLVLLIDGRPDGEPRPLPDGDPCVIGCGRSSRSWRTRQRFATASARRRTSTTFGGCSRA